LKPSLQNTREKERRDVLLKVSSTNEQVKKGPQAEGTTKTKTGVEA